MDTMIFDRFRQLGLLIACLWLSTSAGAALPIPAPPALNVSSYIVIDASTGSIVAAMDADKPVEPASLTKLMTAYVVFNALKAEQITLADLVTISRTASRTGGS
ncbi:MAG: serine hydrolase, partial [Pseudomonadota bacterium]